MESMSRRISGPTGKLVVNDGIEGTGHWIQLDKPADVTAILERFLDAR